MSKMNEIRAAWAQAKIDQVEHQKNPDSADARRTARIAGVMLFAVGLLFCGAVYLYYIWESRVSSLLTGVALTGVGLGLYLMVMGRMPGKPSPTP